MTVRIDSTPSSSIRSRPPESIERLADAIKNLPPEAWQYIVEQARLGGQVTEVEPETFKLYRQWLSVMSAKDTPKLRETFLATLLRRFETKADEQFVKTRQQVPWDDAVGLMKGWSVKDELPMWQIRGSAQKKPPPKKPTANPNSDRFESTRRPSTPGRTQPSTLSPQKIQADTVEEFYAVEATSPDQARSLRADKVALNPKLMKQMQSSVTRGGNPFVGDLGEIGRRAYLDFLRAQRMSDSPQAMKTFVGLMSDRARALVQSGRKNFSLQEGRQFLANNALERLKTKYPGEGPIELKSEDRWMIQALADPSVTLSAEQQQLADRVKWTDMGLPYSLAEVSAKRRAQAEQKPVPGMPYKTDLNADQVFRGDAQVNAFTMAARNGGYTEQETEMARLYMQANGIPLFVDRSKPGEPLINTPTDASTYREEGGQRFVTYSMTGSGLSDLRDARLALQHGYSSLKAYREDFNNTWSDKVNWLGDKWLKSEQGKDQLIGLDNWFTGPLIRGKYDAMREVVMVVANGANLAQMAVSDASLAIRTGNLFARISDDAELSRYFDNAAGRVEQTYSELGRTYSAEETGVVGQVARGVLAGAPKMAVNLVPGAAIFYNALKHANHDLNEFGKETLIDLTSLAGGFAASRVTSAASGALSQFVNGRLAQATVRQVVDRGGTALAGAATNVLIDMGPTAAQKYLLTDEQRAALPEAERKAMDERLGMLAFQRNVWSGVVLGLLLPGRFQKDELIGLNLKAAEKNGVKLVGPMFRTVTPDGAEHHYSAVSVTEKGKTRVDFIEVRDPMAIYTATNEGNVKTARQADVELALAESRWSRLTPKQQADLQAAGNKYAQQKMLLDAEVAVADRDGGLLPVTPEGLRNVEAARAELIAANVALQARKGLTVEPSQTAALRQVRPEKFLAAFGEGRHSEALLELFKQPGFADLVNTSPQKARALYLANRHTDVLARLSQARSELKTSTSGSRLNAMTFDRVLGELSRERTRFTKSGDFFWIERSKSNPSFRMEMIVDDPVSMQRTLRFEGGKVQRAFSDQPSRVHFEPNQVLDFDGQPIDPNKSVLVSTHGTDTSLQGLTPENMNKLAAKIVAERDVKNVVLVACHQGDLRLDGTTYAQKFWADLNLRVQKLSGGKMTIDVMAATEPGPLNSSPGATGSSPVTRDVTSTSSGGARVQPATLKQVFPSGVRIELPAEAPLNTERSTRPVVVYVLRVNRDDNEAKQKNPPQ